MGKYQQERFTAAKGQCDLVLRKDGKWFLLVTVDLPDGTKPPTTDFIGVDLGVANIATDSDGQHYSGDAVEAVRNRQHTLRASLQRAASAKKRRGMRPKNIRRKLKRLSGKERRFRANENHRIAKSLVAKAKGTGRGLALEELQSQPPIANGVSLRGLWARRPRRRERGEEHPLPRQGVCQYA